MSETAASHHFSTDPHRVAVPGGWIYWGGGLISPVLVSDPSIWAPGRGDTPTILAELYSIHSKLETMMATVADVQAALAANETKEDTIIGLLQTEAARLKETQAQLAAALAGGSDSAALQAVLDKMTADAAAMDAAIASVAPPASTGPAAPAAPADPAAPAAPADPAAPAAA